MWHSGWFQKTPYWPQNQLLRLCLLMDCSLPSSSYWKPSAHAIPSALKILSKFSRVPQLPSPHPSSMSSFLNSLSREVPISILIHSSYTSWVYWMLGPGWANHSSHPPETSNLGVKTDMNSKNVGLFTSFMLLDYIMILLFDYYWS